MTEGWSILTDAFSKEQLMTAIRVGTILIIGLVLAKMASAGLVRIGRSYMTPQQTMLIRRATFYILAGLIIATVLRELGFQIGILLGAAGILTVALGFASQTSVSNLISGLFLIGERSFVVGDIVRIAETTGEVLSIDLLSVKIRTFDNLFVRIPNETLIRSPITNLTQFPIRRIDIKVGVAYKENITKVQNLLSDVARRNPLCLVEPEPRLFFLAYGDSSLNLQFSVWAKQENFYTLTTQIHQEIKEAFDAEGIEIPFPHRTFYTGSVTEPLPIRVVGN
jgi:small-conductance mechanosensitive channel